MKNQFIITVAFIAITSFTNQLFAQEPAAKSADWDLAKNKGGISCSVVGTEEGCSFTFQKIEMSNREAGSGLATGRRQHKPFRATFAVSSSDNSVTEVKSPRDVSTGQSSGKRVAPSMASDGISDLSPSTTVQGAGGGTGKVSIQDFHYTVKGNGKTVIVRCPDGSCIIPTDLPDGEYTLLCDWSWGMSQSGGKASPKRGSVDFLLQIENGACMAINEKGLPGEKKPNNTTTNNPK